MFGHTNEPVTLQRDVTAIIIPVGEPVTLREGAVGFLTQALGGSFTIYVEGNLFRIAGTDAAAIGKEPEPPPAIPENATDADIESVIWNQLTTVYDPEIPVNIVDLGLIYDLSIEDAGEDARRVEVKMTLTAQGCGMGPVIADDARTRIEAMPGVESAQVEIVWEPPWNPRMISDEGKKVLGLE